MATQTITVRLPLKGAMLDWQTFDADPSNSIRGMALEEFIDEIKGTNFGSLPVGIPAKESSFRIKLNWIDYDNGVGEYTVTAHTILIAALRPLLNTKTPTEIAADYSATPRVLRPDDLPVDAEHPRGKFAGNTAPPADEDLELPNAI